MTAQTQPAHCESPGTFAARFLADACAAVTREVLAVPCWDISGLCLCSPPLLPPTFVERKIVTPHEGIRLFCSLSLVEANRANCLASVASHLKEGRHNEESNEGRNGTSHIESPVSATCRAKCFPCPGVSFHPELDGAIDHF